MATLAGEHVSLDEVEKGPNGLLPNFSDARLHAAVVYASVYCPDLAEEPFTVANMDHLLDERCRIWLAHTQKGLLLDEMGVLTLSPIFKWYRSDFDAFVRGNGSGGLRSFLEEFAPAAVARKLLKFPEEAFAEATLQYFSYDWNLNGTPPEPPAARL